MEHSIPIFVPIPGTSPCKFLCWQEERAAFWTLPGPDEEIDAVEWDDTKQSWVERHIDWDGYELWKTVPTGWLQSGSQLKDFTFFYRLSQAVALFKVAQGFPHRDAKLCQIFTVGTIMMVGSQISRQTHGVSRRALGRVSRRLTECVTLSCTRAVPCARAKIVALSKSQKDLFAIEKNASLSHCLT